MMSRKTNSESTKRSNFSWKNMGERNQNGGANERKGKDV
jgi:hypothetical protein